MAARKTKAAKEALEVIERAQILSKQPRLGATVDKERLFASVYKWLKSEAENEPKYQSDNRPRDRWLSEAWMKEPHLAGGTTYRDWETDRKSTRLNSSHRSLSRMPSSA